MSRTVDSDSLDVPHGRTGGPAWAPPAQDPRDAPAFDLRLTADKTGLLFDDVPQVCVSSFVAAGVWVGAMWRMLASAPLLWWWLLFAAAVAVRAVAYLRYRAQRPSPGQAGTWLRRYVGVVMSSALIWGLGTVLLVRDAGLLPQIATFSFLVCLSGAALVTYGLFPRLTLAVIVVLLLPIETVLVLDGVAFARWMALSALLFSISTLVGVHAYARRMEESFLRTYRLQEANRIAQWHAETDVLTGLKNRRAFSAAGRALIELAARERQPVSVMVIDLDRFKQINDGHGHSAGDAVLAGMGDLLRATLRRSDICGRFGGDEFAVLLPNTALEAAQAVAEKLHEAAMRTTVPLPGHDTALSFSIGIASGAGEDFDALMGRADQAMYQAKRCGSHRNVAQ